MPPKTLIDGYTFLVTPDAPTPGFAAGGTGGLYHRDTRYLSGLEYGLDGADLAQIGGTLETPAVRTETYAPTTPAVNELSAVNLAKHTDTSVTCRHEVCEGVGYLQTTEVANHAVDPRRVELTVRFTTDFADLFEVRGLTSGIDRSVGTAVGDETVRLRYDADGSEVCWETTLAFAPTPDELHADRARFTADLAPGESATLRLTAGLGPERVSPAAVRGRTPAVEFPAIPGGLGGFAGVFGQAAADLVALSTPTDHGPVPLAGTPWFVTPFGRDALLTAYQTLPVAPALAEGTLRYLAASRGRTVDAETEEEVGKVFHEQRHGELAARGLIPHTPYYGSVDATPLWVLLLAELVDWRGSPALAADLWPALVEALDWIRERSAAGPADPFLYYEGSPGGLDHKAWKDTADSIRFADGTPADEPLAVAEVQGYAAAALRRGAGLVDRVAAAGRRPDDAPTPAPDAYRDLATRIGQSFAEEFWLPDRAFYGLAKAGDGRVVDAVASNLGHCLWTGLVPGERADDVVETLTDEALAGGWGLRTMSRADAGYSPVSYHAGGVWPHDTSIAALGLARYGYGDAAERLGRHVLAAATTFPNDRLPELYCGFDRDREPATYPAACTPQAWGAGAPFAVLRAAFGLQPGADGGFRVARNPELFGTDALAPVRDTWAELDTDRAASADSP